MTDEFGLFQNAYMSVPLYMLNWFPPEAERVVVKAGGASRVFRMTTLGYTPDGRTTLVRYDDLVPLIKAVRHEMYEPGTGTWFSIMFTVTSDGKGSTEYDYDGEPENTDIMDPTEWVYELRIYPRDAEHIPDWLRMNLDISYQAFPQLLAEDIAANRPWLTDADRRR